MRISRSLRQAWLLLLVVVVGCAPAARQPVERATASKPYSVDDEGKVPPPVADADARAEADVEEQPVQEAPIEFEEAEAPIDSAALVPPPEMIPGFRVQVFATAAEKVAESARKSAQERLAVPAYADLVDGMYKIRVGDCATREAAEALLKRCHETYYKDAWIVESPVRADRAQP